MRAKRPTVPTTFFHDLVNHLTVVTLYLHEAKEQQVAGKKIEAAEHIDAALQALDRVYTFINEEKTTK